MTEKSNKSYYPLSHPQKRVWYMEHIYDNAPMYNIGGYLIIKGNVNIKLLDKTLNILVSKNDAFRLRVTEWKEGIYQYVEDYKETSIDFIDFSIERIPNKTFENWLNSQFNTSMLKVNSALYYFAIYKLSDNEYGVFLKMHHIISDGWSFGIIVKQVCDIYGKLVKDEYIDENYENSYIKYINKETDYENSNRILKDRAFWLEKLENYSQNVIFENSEKTEANRICFDIDSDKSLNIRKFLKLNNLSLNSFFTYVSLVYFSKYYQVNEMIIGIPIYNRVGREERNTVGMFTSTMPFAYKINDSESAINILKDINKELMKCFFHQKYPYDSLIKDIGIIQKGNESMFEVCVNYYNSTFNNQISGMPLEIYESFANNQAYPMQIVVKDWSDTGNIGLSFDYKVSVLHKEAIDFMYYCFNNIIDETLIMPDIEIKNLSLMTNFDVNRLSECLSSKNVMYPKEKTIVNLFEEQVVRTPDAIALIYEGQELSYKKLNEMANQIARKLTALGIGRTDIVGLAVKHSFDTVLGIFGVLKAGAAYLPIDPDYPADRINYMIDDSEVEILLTNCKLSEKIKSNVNIIDLNDSKIYVGETGNLRNVNTSRDLAYIIYTSGSTGKPKGVMIEHMGLVNYICWARKMYIKGNESFALYSSLSFDLTVTSIFTPLINGNSIYIYRDNDDEFILFKILRDNKANVIKLTPAHLSLIKDIDNRTTSVKTLIVGGENLKCSVAASVYESFGGKVEILNEYGPTETVVGCMLYKYDYDNDKTGSVPIGLPADNVQLYILDRNLQVVPIGAIGELYISGDGVARGYIGKPELTSKCFIGNPFIKGKIMYKSGDAVKYRFDGKIEFIGRMDRQVKIRGHRIELGEIEERLINIKGVTDALVITREDNGKEKHLYGYYVTQEDISINEIRAYLSASLPIYMVPNYLVRLEKIPLTTNGKVNLNLLPEPEKTNQGLIADSTFRNINEEMLAKVMEEVLNIGRVGAKDNFYELGGDSIKAIQIANKLNNFGLSIKVKDILSRRVIEEIAGAIEVRGNKDVAEQEICIGNLGQTPIIKWFFNQRFDNINHWNQSILLEIDHQVTEEMLQLSIAELIKHHDTLRINYSKKDDFLFYNNKHLDTGVSFEFYDLSQFTYEIQQLKIKEIGAKMKSSFVIEDTLLFNVGMFDLGNKSKRLLLTSHHLLVDGISWRILIEDLCNILKCLINGDVYKMPPKTHSFGKWVNEIMNYSESIKSNEIDYWNNVLKGQIQFTTDHDLGEDKVNSAIVLKRELDTITTKLLMTEANRAYGTDTNELLIIALLLTISKITNKQAITFELESHGREDISERVDVSRTVGWFTNMYPVNLNLIGKDIKENIKLLKEQLRAVPNNGFNYGIIKYIKNAISYEMKKHIRFNFMGDFSNALADNIFRIATEDSGTDYGLGNNLTSLLEFVAIIQNDRLNISITYSTNKYKNTTITDLADEYICQINDLVKHCCEQQTREFTPSDFDGVDLSMEDLENLFI